jgi:hypothetical protein
MRGRTWLSNRSQYRPFRQVADHKVLPIGSFRLRDAQSDFTCLRSPATPACHSVSRLSASEDALVSESLRRKV